MTVGLTFTPESIITYKARAYTYKQTGTPRTIRPIELADLQAHAKIDFVDTGQTDYINFLIDAAVDAAERFTNRSFINQTWKTYRDFFTAFITLRRGTNAIVNSFKYFNTSNILTVVPADSYYVSVQNPYSSIVFKMDSQFPGDVLLQQNCIEIEFTAGYGAAKIDVPFGLRMLLLQHVTWLYENKGNCPVDEIPPIVLNGYKKHFRVIDINATTYL